MARLPRWIKVVGFTTSPPGEVGMFHLTIRIRYWHPGFWWWFCTRFCTNWRRAYLELQRARETE